MVLVINMTKLIGLSIICKIAAGISFIQVQEPQNVQQLFPNGIQSSMMDVGHPPYNQVVTGRLIFQNISDDCTFVQVPPDITDAILVSDQRNCETIKIAQASKEAGAFGTFLTVYQENVYSIQFGNIENSEFIESFIVAISKQSAADIQQIAGNQEVIVQIDLRTTFVNPINLHIYLSSSVQKNYQFLTPFLDEMKTMKTSQVNVTLSFLIISWQNCFFHVSSCEPINDCIETDTHYYCTAPLALPITRGKELIKLYLYTYCVLEATKLQPTYENFSSYIELLNIECDNDYDESCVQSALVSSGYQNSYVQQCIASTFSEGAYGSGSNSVLVKMSSQVFKNDGQLKYPSVKYNEMQFKGAQVFESLDVPLQQDVQVIETIQAQEETNQESEEEGNGQSEETESVLPTEDGHEDIPSDPPNEESPTQEETTPPTSPNSPSTPPLCAPNCTSNLLQNSTCDPVCNKPSCNYDNRACIECDPGCYLTMLGDGKCDENCNTSNCFYDKLDCCSCTSEIGNGVCDSACNTEQCKFDGGDCQECSPGCYKNMIGNQVCDQACYNDACMFDKLDCECNCEKGRLGDGVCQGECNNDLCEYDLGDCVTPEEVVKQDEEEGVDEEEETNSAGLYGGLAGGILVLVLIAGAIVYCRYKKRRPLNETIIEHSNDSESQRNIGQNELERKMPIKSFNTNLVKYGSNTCAICLDEQLIYRFYPNIAVRVTECYHVFHGTCIDEWIVQSTRKRCPCCNKLLG